MNGQGVASPNGDGDGRTDGMGGRTVEEWNVGQSQQNNGATVALSKGMRRPRGCESRKGEERAKEKGSSLDDWGVRGIHQ